MAALGWIVPLGAIAIWAALFLRAVRQRRRTPVVSPRDPALSVPPASLPVIVAFVPARNEARVIAPCLTALAHQGSTLDRIVVIDDRSNDGTRDRLNELLEKVPNLIVIDGRGPGPGECGKPAALRDAVAAAFPDREWLLFLDADVILAPGALGGLLDLARERGADLISVLPRLDMIGKVERLVMPSFGALIAALYPADRIADPSSPLAFANGQLILVRRTAYEAAGGHAAVVSEILEDVRLAERIKKNGGVLCLADGRNAARTRMYEGWDELVEGWSKNLFPLFGSSAAKSLGIALGSVLTASLAWLSLTLGDWPLGAIGCAFVLAIQMFLRRQGGAPPGWALLAPVAALAVAYVTLRSLRLYLGKRPIAWKGRSYAAPKKEI